MQSKIKISKNEYEILAGSDWPNHAKYLKNDYTVRQTIQEEINSYERNFKYLVGNTDLIIEYLGQSQAQQDLFVIAMTQGKLFGNYLEIGAGNPILGNNTFALEQHLNYSGISIDIDQTILSEWNAKRPNSNIEICDALNFDYSKLPAHFDYLQIDIDPPINNLYILEKILKTQTFSVITFEHDIWRKTDETTFLMNESRNLLKNCGYSLIANNVTIVPGNGKGIGNEPIFFEDWYANPNYIKKEVIKAYTTIDYSDNPKYSEQIIFK